MKLIPLSMDDFEGAVRLALRMRAAQRRYYGLHRDDPGKRDALMASTTLERDFDRLTRDWEVEDG